VQVPAYYDQIVGDLYLVRGGAALAKGSVDTLQEGGGTSVLPPQEQKVAALPANPQPIASFTRSNSGWMVIVSLPEAATQFGYRIGDKGEFTDAGLLDALDQRTGTRMPKTSFEMAKKILEQFWTSWIAFREYNGMLVYFTQLVSYRCAIKEVRYSLSDGPVEKIFKLPPCDPVDPNSVPDGATLYMKVPPKTAYMQVQLTYADGTKSPTRSFNAPK